MLRPGQAEGIRLKFAQQSSSLPVRVQFYEAIRAAILAGILSPGQTLNEGELAAALSVSRTPIREGLQRLEAEGWLNRATARSLGVSAITEKDIRHLYRMRAVLEGLAAELAVPVTPEHKPNLKRMEWLVREIDLHTKRNDPEAVGQKNREFHTLLIEMAGSKVLTSTLKSIYDQIERVREGGLWARGRLDAALSEHLQLFDAICAGDTKKSSELVQRHVINAGDAVLQQLTSKGEIMENGHSR